MIRNHRQHLLTAVMGLSIVAQTAGQTVRTVAIRGQPLPGAGGETFQGNLRLPVIDARGRVSFSAIVGANDGNSFVNNGVWSETGGSLAMVVRAGQPAVGLPTGVNFGSEAFPVFEPVFNSANQAAFVGRVHGTGVTTLNNSGIWFNDGSSTELILREGDPAVGAPAGVRYGGEYYFAFRQLVFNDAGQLSFVATITGSSDPLLTEGIWTARNGAVSLIARDGGRAPGTPTGVIFGSQFTDSSTTLSLTFTNISLNPAGQTVFVGRLRGSGVTEANHLGIWIADADSVDLFMRAGSQAPGTAAGTNFRTFPAVALDPAGHVAFLASLQGGDAASTNDSGIWTNRGGPLALFLREGDAAPQISPNAQFTGVDSSTLVVNAVGDMAFIAAVAGAGISTANDKAIWNTAGGQLELVAREGSHAPGTGGGAFFADFGNDSGPVFNSRGQSAFVARLAGAGVNSTNDRGIWAEDLAGELHLIAREGDLLEVAPGDLRQISFVNFLGQSGLVDGPGAGFNDLGQVVFNAGFTNGTSGVFVSNLVAVPEPPAMLLLAIGGVVILCCSRAVSRDVLMVVRPRDT